jgi:hypothetical protein
VASVEKYREALERIASASQSGESRIIDRAAVEEGFSGLGKLLGLLRRVRSPYVSLVVVPDEATLNICFELTLPAEITFGRERG